MQGFSNRFKDFPDYILTITEEIWERRDLTSLHDCYAKDIIVRSPASVSTGNPNVIAATMATLSEFPDRRLLGEDVIWSGTPETGMLSSHRILSTATHLGDGAYGKASGKKLFYRVIADCHAKNNFIDDEWLIRDQGAIIRQIGWQPDEYVKNLRDSGKSLSCFLPENDIVGPYQGKGNDNEWGQKLANYLHRMMKADFTVFEQEYDRAANLFYPSGHETCSFDGAQQFWIGLRSSFPSAEFKIHHQIGRDDDMMPPRAAIRWSLDGKHDGFGLFGAPTQKRVYIMGATHVEFGPYGVRREYTLYDEIIIWQQILS